jgi:hypothetical protein
MSSWYAFLSFNLYLFKSWKMYLKNCSLLTIVGCFILKVHFSPLIGAQKFYSWNLLITSEIIFISWKNLWNFCCWLFNFFCLGIFPQFVFPCRSQENYSNYKALEKTNNCVCEKIFEEEKNRDLIRSNNSYLNSFARFLYLLICESQKCLETHHVDFIIRVYMYGRDCREGYILHHYLIF